MPSTLLVEALAHFRQGLLKMELLPQELEVPMFTDEENLSSLLLLLFIEVSRVEMVMGLNWPAGKGEGTAAKLGLVKDVKFEML